MQASAVTLEGTFRALTIRASNLIEARNASQVNGVKCVAGKCSGAPDASSQWRRTIA
jgi:hypothetical protein